MLKKMYDLFYPDPDASLEPNSLVFSSATCKIASNIFILLTFVQVFTISRFIGNNKTQILGCLTLLTGII